MNWEDLEKINGELKTVEIKQGNKSNDYVPVNERVIGFRKLFPMGQIITEPSFTENYVMFEAVALDDKGNILAKGHARELGKNQFAMEKCETSAVGRCLAFLGIGTKAGIASKEDMEEYANSKIFDEPTNLVDLAAEVNSLYTKKEQVDILNVNHVSRMEDLGKQELMRLINLKKYATTGY